MEHVILIRHACRHANSKQPPGEKQLDAALDVPSRRRPSCRSALVMWFSDGLAPAVSANTGSRRAAPGASTT
eukprot:6667384-Karenia_brevis.AAC.1